MLLDLHTHSVASDDSRATVEQYIKWANVLRKKGKSIDGFVLTETGNLIIVSTTVVWRLKVA